MTTEIKDEDLAIFTRHPNGLAYSFDPSSYRMLDYAFYKNPNSVGWLQSASVTVQKVIMEAEWFSPENNAALAIRAQFADEIKARLDLVTGVKQESEKLGTKLSRIDIIGQNGNTGEHYSLSRDQVVAAIGDKLCHNGKAGLPYVLDAMQSTGLTVAVAVAATLSMDE